MLYNSEQRERERGGGGGERGGGGVQIVLTYLTTIFNNILKTTQIPDS